MKDDKNGLNLVRVMLRVRMLDKTGVGHRGCLFWKYSKKKKKEERMKRRRDDERERETRIYFVVTKFYDNCERFSAWSKAKIFI